MGGFLIVVLIYAKLDGFLETWQIFWHVSFITSTSGSFETIEFLQRRCSTALKTSTHKI